MGRPKGSKNKPKVVQHDTNVREMPATDSRSIGNVGISILELTEEIKVREIPSLQYNINAARTKGIEKRIRSLITRAKSFYLHTDILTDHTDYFVDSGGWAFSKTNDKYDIMIGHVKNLLPFLGGPLPIWQQKRTYTRHRVRRGMHIG